MECKIPFTIFQESNWQYSSGVLEAILLFCSLILPLVHNPKEKKMWTKVSTQRQSLWSVIRAKQNKSKGNNQNLQQRHKDKEHKLYPHDGLLFSY